MESKLNEYFMALKKHPKLMMMGDVRSISSYVSYFEGLFLGLRLLTKINFEREISKWYQKKAKIKAPNMIWFGQLQLENKELGEEAQITLMLDLIHEFFLENLKLLENQCDRPEISTE